MAIEKFPQDDEDSKKEPHVHQPEYIILEDDKETGGYSEFSKEEQSYLHSFQSITKVQYPLFFRFFILGISVVVFLASFVVLALLLGSLVIGVLGLFRSEELNKPIIRFWKGYRRMLVFSLGLFIAAFSPPLGFSLILMYLFLLGEPLDGGFFQRIITSRFRGN